MTGLLALTALTALILGFALGRWTRPARANGKLTVKYSGPLHVERTELSHGRAPEVFISREEAL